MLNNFLQAWADLHIQTLDDGAKFFIPKYLGVEATTSPHQNLSIGFDRLSAAYIAECCLSGYFR